MNKKIEGRLWELRLEVVDAYEKLVEQQAIQSSADKISGYTEHGILMQPEAMQQVIGVLENARQSNELIRDFGRSLPKKTEVEKENDEVEGVLARFGRSVNTTEEPPTAADNVVKKEESSNKVKNTEEREFVQAMKRLEDFMTDNGLEHPMPCRSKKLEQEDIDRMNKEIGETDYEDNCDKIQALQRVRALSSKTLFQFCDKKPYQCLVCPYYYEDFTEFWKMKEKRKKND